MPQIKFTKVKVFYFEGCFILKCKVAGDMGTDLRSVKHFTVQSELCLLQEWGQQNVMLLKLPHSTENRGEACCVFLESDYTLNNAGKLILQSSF